MSLAQRFERRLEGLVGGAFARLFKGQVEPVEIGSALQREAADRKNIMGDGEVLCPNRYRVTLAPSDYERLVPWESQLTGALAELVQEHLDENRWNTIGDIEVYLARDEELRTGVFGVASRMESAAPPRRRPYDSLSLPAAGGTHAPRDEHQGEWQDARGGPNGYPDAAMPPVAMRPPAPRQPQPTPPPNYPSYGPAYGPPQRPQHGPGGAALVVDPTNQHFELRIGSNVIGRGSDADLQLLDQGVSRRHLDVQYDGQRATVYDLGSTNGTTVNGHEVGSHVLRHGDVVRIGHTRMVFHQEQM